MLLALGLAKMLVTAVCFASGTPGGMFAPTLFTGAMIGGGIGALAQVYWPAPVSPPGAYVLVGMGTFFAAVFRAPMTSIFMVFEVSASYVIIVPVMVANLVAYFVARQLNPRSFFEMVAAQDGVQLPSLERQREMRVLRVEDAMSNADTTPTETAQLLPVVHPDQSLDAALLLFQHHRRLRVVSRRDVTRTLGLLTLEDALRAYGIRADASGSARHDADAPAPASRG
jgi:CIC family chloride channel protein